MKIALCDLNHTTRGIHTNTVPLGLGLIYSYFKKKIDHDFEVKIFKNAENFLHILTTWLPSVLGITQYSWNSELNLYIAKHVKILNPHCLIIAGGPNLNLTTPQREIFLKKNSFVDICVAFDGEIPFAEILKRLLNGESSQRIKSNPVPGSYSLSPENGQIIESSEKIPRLQSLNEFGPVYAEGIFKEMLDEGFHPFVQTHRGCPFTCSFCHTSDKYYSKMLFLSSEIFEQDMNYLGEMFADQSNVILYIANTNMSLFNEDFLIADIIRKTKEKYGWPKLINVNSGKNPDKLIDMLKVIHFQPGIALQTLTPHVLQNIKRKNIPFEDFLAFQKKVSTLIEKPSATELILCLPGETKKSFLNTLKKILNSEIENIVIYTLMKLKGTPLALEENAKKYKYLVRHRIVPRQFSRINGELILDTEEVIVSTNTMSYDDYTVLRGLSFIVTVFFSSIELNPLKKFLIEENIDIAQWIFNIHDKIKDNHDLFMVYSQFLNETDSELFLSKQDLKNFYNIQNNYDLLSSGQLGDNLLRKYKCIILSKYFDQLLDLAISEASLALNDSKKNEIFDDLKTFISYRDLRQCINNNSINREKLHLKYDIPNWLKKRNEVWPLNNYCQPVDYMVTLPQKAKERFNNIVELNKDFDLSLQIMYRDGITMQFWPTWEKIESTKGDQ